MTEKEMIEEMARVICPNSKAWTCKACNWGSKPNCDAYKNAEKLINAGYRNCKDKVVLSKEEYEGKEIVVEMSGGHKLRLTVGKFGEMSRVLEESTRKETVEEFYQSFINELMRGCGDDKEFWAVKLINKKAKQFGVEVEE